MSAVCLLQIQPLTQPHLPPARLPHQHPVVPLLAPPQLPLLLLVVVPPVPPVPPLRVPPRGVPPLQTVPGVHHEERRLFFRACQAWCDLHDWEVNSHGLDYWESCHTPIQGPISQMFVELIIQIQIIWKIISRSGHYFTPATAAKLPWHVQNCELIWQLESKWHPTEFLENFNFELVNHL